MRRFFEFFAGGGMARAGLGEGWHCAFANDFDPRKAAAYRANWGGEALVCADVSSLTPDELPGRTDLAWASFPCQDLSLAGGNRGLGAAGANTPTRSGTFWPFWSLVEALRGAGRGPRLLVLENVYGAITSKGGADFTAIATTLADAGYRFGAMGIDAKGFVPQSRPRLFILAVAEGVALPLGLVADEVPTDWVPDQLVAAYDRLPPTVRASALWWNLLPANAKRPTLTDLIETEGTAWHAPSMTDRLLGLMTPLHHAKIAAAQATGRREVGTVYRRTRADGQGGKVQRAEVRFDGLAGCLRTPSGGSSRQTLMVVEGSSIRTRLLTAREAARLMGLPDSYILPARYNDAYHLAGDGVVVPVVAHLARYLIEPILDFDDLSCTGRAAACPPQTHIEHATNMHPTHPFPAA